MGYWLVTMGALLGAGFALTFVGLASGPRWLKLGFLVAILLAMAGARVLRGYEGRKLRELGRHLDAVAGGSHAPAP
jgi:hypothetical protein